MARRFGHLPGLLSSAQVALQVPSDRNLFPFRPALENNVPQGCCKVARQPLPRCARRQEQPKDAFEAVSTPCGNTVPDRQRPSPPRPRRTMKLLGVWLVRHCSRRMQGCPATARPWRVLRVPCDLPRRHGLPRGQPEERGMPLLRSRGDWCGTAARSIGALYPRHRWRCHQAPHGPRWMYRMGSISVAQSDLKDFYHLPMPAELTSYFSWLT